MGPSVDANSLSEITQLASNPPKHPRNLTEQKRDPLTLYIARVPGSRDIILTTLKPQLKNVTAEDVAASLYLLHLNTEDDLNLLGDFVADENITPQEKPLPRKPLPDSARSSLDGQRIGNPAIQDGTTAFPKRKPITGLVPTHAQKVYLPAETLPRKPFGPRPQVQEPALDRKPLPGVENTRQILSSQDQNLAPSSQRSADDAHSFQAHESLSGSAATRKYSAKDFSITIIRRDLSSGAQWNVGSIAGQPIAQTTGESRDGSTRRSRKPYFDMLIELTNPGYTYFRDQTRGHTNLHQKSRSDSEVFKQQTQMTFDESFHREIHMEGSSFWGRSSMHHRRTRSNLSDVSSRGLSLSNAKAGDSSGRSPRNSGENSDRVGGSETKGYIFYSPWDGPCKFTTGSGGRSLRCTHTLPAAVSATMGDGKPPQESVPVSELRFNLPSSAVFKPSGTAGTKGKASAGTHRFHIPKFGNIRNKLSPSKVHGTHQPQLDPTSYSAMYPSDDESGPPLPLRPKPIQQASTHTVKADLLQQAQIYRSHLEDESDSRLDLSIGKEKAGGGNRGKRAKLGKLIIYDEGFKMLDLIVGANMSVWWSVWETDR